MTKVKDWGQPQRAPGMVPFMSDLVAVKPPVPDPVRDPTPLEFPCAVHRKDIAFSDGDGTPRRVFIEIKYTLASVPQMVARYAIKPLIAGNGIRDYEIPGFTLGDHIPGRVDDLAHHWIPIYEWPKDRYAPKEPLINWSPVCAVNFEPFPHTDRIDYATAVMLNGANLGPEVIDFDDGVLITLEPRQPRTAARPSTEQTHQVTHDITVTHKAGSPIDSETVVAALRHLNHTQASVMDPKVVLARGWTDCGTKLVWADFSTTPSAGDEPGG